MTFHGEYFFHPVKQSQCVGTILLAGQRIHRTPDIVHQTHGFILIIPLHLVASNDPPGSIHSGRNTRQGAIWLALQR